MISLLRAGLSGDAGTLIADQSTGNFRTESSAVSKTAYITTGGYTFEMTDTFGDGICCQYGAREFNITMNGAAGTISSSGEYRDVVRKDFDVSGAILAPPYPYEANW